jgi:hypothetical protein
MTRDEVTKKRQEALQMIQQGLGMIENLKGQVAQARGKIAVYDEMLAEMPDGDGDSKALSAVPDETPQEEGAEA